MKIKTLAEILAESETDSANLPVSKAKTTSQKSLKTTVDSNRHFKNKKSESQKSPHSKRSAIDDDFISYDDVTRHVSSEYSETNSSEKKSKKRKKQFHPAAHFTVEPNDTPAYQAPESQSIKQILAEVKREVHGDTEDSNNEECDNQPDDTTGNDKVADTDNLPSALKAYLRSPEQRQADIDEVKAESRLRWLAFYYLSRREYGKAELKQKLIDKEQNPEKIDALLEEFEEKGYQSDYRTTLMLIRESIRKGRGRGHIKQEFYRKKIDMPSNIDELIELANEESDEFVDFIADSEDSMVDGVDWLKLAVTARTKKYGYTIPSDQKNKARQLRFLQYRGFDMDICFQALKYTLDTLDERF